MLGKGKNPDPRCRRLSECCALPAEHNSRPCAATVVFHSAKEEVSAIQVSPLPLYFSLTKPTTPSISSSSSSSSSTSSAASTNKEERSKKNSSLLDHPASLSAVNLYEKPSFSSSSSSTSSTFSEPSEWQISFVPRRQRTLPTAEEKLELERAEQQVELLKTEEEERAWSLARLKSTLAEEKQKESERNVGAELRGGHSVDDEALVDPLEEYALWKQRELRRLKIFCDGFDQLSITESSS